MIDLKSLAEKWQAKWKAENIYQTHEGGDKPKYYILDMFPYPSGAGLHVGHPKGYVASDTIARKKMLQGFNVLHPMGFDTFGLGTEQYAIDHKMKPQVVAKQNIETFIQQLQNMGFSYDWDRSFSTADPDYYRWTQWIFLQLYTHYYDLEAQKAKPLSDLEAQLKKEGKSDSEIQEILDAERLAYLDYKPINRCPSCQTGLANEDLEDGSCERCGSEVEQKPMRQWVLRITKYAERLIQDLDQLDRDDSVKELQKNWIGKSQGSQFKMKIKDHEESFEVYTTRLDTVFGMTFVVMAPEHPLVDQITTSEYQTAVAKYKDQAKHKTQLERTELQKEKTGQFTGAYAINPFNGQAVPIYIGDYVLANYGTGVVMAVPAHDERDFEFAKKYDIPIIQSVAKHYLGQGIDTPQDTVETLERKVVDCIIENDQGEFLLEIEENPHHGHFVGGGIEDGDSDLETVEKEIIEETGYTEFEIKGAIPGTFSSVLAHRHTKHKNQKTLGEFFHIKLQSEKQIPSEIEIGKHQIKWVKKEEVLGQITRPHHADARKAFLEGVQCYPEKGIVVNSGKFSGLASDEAILAMQERLTQHGIGGKKTNYKIQDWVFSRQRYWGEPFPIVFCPDCGPISLDESDLPLELPEVENYAPTGREEGPLADIDRWINTPCPHCGKPARRESNTMPGWAGSSRYWMRYMDPRNDQALVDPLKDQYWKNVDVYVGGAEHITRHMIYARFWQKFLFDLGVISTAEPFQKYQKVGLIMAEDGRKMSKRRGNVVNPDDIIGEYGSDVFRTYEMFMGPFDQSIAWSTNGIKGVKKFLDKVILLYDKIDPNLNAESPKNLSILHQSIKKLTTEIDEFKFNTSIAQLMILVNTLSESETIIRSTFETLIILLAPFAPHLAEEFWSILGNEFSLFTKAQWPQYEEKYLVSTEATFAVQINGKMRGTLVLSADSKQEEVFAAVQGDQKLSGYFGGEVKKIIFVPGKIINIIL